MRARFALLVLSLLLVVPLASAQRGEQQQRRGGPGTGNPNEHLAPWKYVEGADWKPDAPVTLVWVPQSLEKAELSPLMLSEKLVEDANRCVALRVILPDQTALLKKLGIAPNTTTAVIVNREGKVIREAKSASPGHVEALVAQELDARDEAVYHDLHQAAEFAKSGNNAAAIAVYQKIWDDRCLFALAGHEAQRELAKLGVIVKETKTPPPPDPNLAPKKP